jgi:hypothetical protein
MSGIIEQVGGSNLKGLAPTAAGESWMRPRIVPANVTTRHYTRCREDGNFIEKFVVLCPVGEQRVYTLGPAGEEFRWGCRHTGPDEITFYPHPGYTGGPLMYYHGPECISVRMEPEAEKLFFFGGSDHANDDRPGEGHQGP